MKNSIRVGILEQRKYSKQRYLKCQILGEDSRKRYLYKYMDMESAIQCIKKKELRFVEPSLWKDQYEKLFYTANYSKVAGGSKFPITLFANCFTKERASESSWKTYVYDKNGIASRCVQFKINRAKFRKALSDSSFINQATIYEGQCSYILNDIDIINIAQKKSPWHIDLFQNGMNLSIFMSLLLIKRKCFRYENECRFFLVKDVKSKLRNHGRKKAGQHIILSLDWKLFVESILVDDKCSDTELDMFSAACIAAGLPLPKRNDLYSVPIRLPVIIE